MFNSKIGVRIYGDNTEDVKRLDTAILVLTEIVDALTKADNNDDYIDTETEVYDLQHACDVLYEVKEGKYF